MSYKVTSWSKYGRGGTRTLDLTVIDAIPAGLHFHILLIEILTADLLYPIQQQMCPQRISMSIVSI